MNKEKLDSLQLELVRLYKLLLPEEEVSEEEKRNSMQLEKKLQKAKNKS